MDWPADGMDDGEGTGEGFMRAFSRLPRLTREIASELTGRRAARAHPIAALNCGHKLRQISLIKREFLPRRPSSSKEGAGGKMDRVRDCVNGWRGAERLGQKCEKKGTKYHI